MKKQAKVRTTDKEEQELIEKVYKMLDSQRETGKPMGNWCYREHIRNVAEFIVTGPIRDLLQKEEILKDEDMPWYSL